MRFASSALAPPAPALPLAAAPWAPLPPLASLAPPVFLAPSPSLPGRYGLALLTWPDCPPARLTPPGLPGPLAPWAPAPWPPKCVAFLGSWPSGPLAALNPGPPEPLALALALGLSLLFSPAIPRKKKRSKAADYCAGQTERGKVQPASLTSSKHRF